MQNASRNNAYAVSHNEKDMVDGVARFPTRVRVETEIYTRTATPDANVQPC